jgi:hypothetical protein
MANWYERNRSRRFFSGLELKKLVLAGESGTSAKAAASRFPLGREEGMSFDRIAAVQSESQSPSFLPGLRIYQGNESISAPLEGEVCVSHTSV